MPTRGELSTEIQLDVGGRTANDVKAAVDTAINRSIEHFEQERFSFNVDVDGTLNSVIDETTYTLPARILSVVAVQFSSNNDLDLLDQWTYRNHLDAITDDFNLTGDPSQYAIFGRSLFLYPAPSNVSPITISGVVRLDNVPFTSDTQTNAWTNEGLSLIRARTKWDLYTNRFKNADLAAVNKEDTGLYLRQLRRDLEQLETIGRIPYYEPF